MPAELIHVNQGRFTFDRAVGHIATALSPLGAAANIAATIGACAVEISRFRLASEHLHVQRDVAYGIIRNRQAEIILLYNTQKEISMGLTVSIRSMASALDGLINVACNLSAPKRSLKLAEHMIPIMTSDLRSINSEAGDSIVRLSESLRLGRTDAAVAAWRQIER